jgi:hypothetical protein
MRSHLRPKEIVFLIHLRLKFLLLYFHRLDDSVKLTPMVALRGSYLISEAEVVFEVFEA